MTKREVALVAVDALVPDPRQPRKDFGEEALGSLGLSMEAQGQIHPLLAFRRDGQLVILDGERRWRCARALGWDSVEVIVLENALPGMEALEKALASNLQREGLNAMEVARAVGDVLRESGATAKELAGRLGFSGAWMSKLMALLSLPESVQELVRSGALSAAAAYELSRLGDAEAQQQLARIAADGRLSRDAVARRVSAKRNGKSVRTPASSRASRIDVRLPGGARLALIGMKLASIDDLVACLDDVCGRARKARGKMSLQTFLGLLRDEAEGRAS